MVFEDMHWADDGLLDFVEHLLDWSAQHPIFMLTFARPEMSEKRAGWPAGHRSATVISLEPLATGDGHPARRAGDAARRRHDRIISRAEGIPLYAVGIVRGARRSRGAFERDGALVLTGELGELDVPASLISLLAARLDALGSEERQLVKAMSVFGGTSRGPPRRRWAASPTQALARCCPSLVRKQVLTVPLDPLSPDRGPVRPSARRFSGRSRTTCSPSASESLATSRRRSTFARVRGGGRGRRGGRRRALPRCLPGGGQRLGRRRAPRRGAGRAAPRRGAGLEHRGPGGRRSARTARRSSSSPATTSSAPSWRRRLEG